MNPQDLDIADLLTPIEPEEALVADDAVAGGIATATGKEVTPETEDTDSATVPGMTPPGGGSGATDEEVHEVWVKLEDDQGNAVKGEKFKIKFSDGSTKSGKTGDDGVGGFPRVPAGTCKVNFPNIHKTEWS